jgi:hypothetical protein
MSRKLNHEETTGNAGPASFPQPILVEMDISGPGPDPQKNGIQPSNIIL